MCLSVCWPLLCVAMCWHDLQLAQSQGVRTRDKRFRGGEQGTFMSSNLSIAFACRWRRAEADTVSFTVTVRIPSSGWSTQIQRKMENLYHRNNLDNGPLVRKCHAHQNRRGCMRKSMLLMPHRHTPIQKQVHTQTLTLYSQCKKTKGDNFSATRRMCEKQV